MVVGLAPLPPTTPNLEGMPCHEIPILSNDALEIINSMPQYPQYDTDKDYFLTSSGKVIMVKPEWYKNRDKMTGLLKDEPDALPLIWEDWLIGPSDGPRTLTLGTARIILATGLKGGGKSLTLAYLGAKSLVTGVPVWSNMNIKFWLVTDDHGLIYCESMPLDWSAFLCLSKDLVNGAIVIDELTYFLSSRQTQSIRNRIINAGINQVRKRTLDFYASVKFIRQVDVNMRDELDCEFACTDKAQLGGGQDIGLPKGCFIDWEVRDISGWSGNPVKVNRYDDIVEDNSHPIYSVHRPHRQFDGRPFWPIYNSYEVIDTADAFRKVRLDLRETVISDRPDESARTNVISSLIDTFRDEGYEQVECGDMRQVIQKAGLDISERELGKILKNSFGITRKRTNRANYYNISEEA